MNPSLRFAALAAIGATMTVLACGGPEPVPQSSAEKPRSPGTVYLVPDTTIDAMLEASGVAEPFAQATLGTKLMGTVTAVLVHEGDRVVAGQPLVHIDARDLVARQAQVTAGIAEANAVHRDALIQAERIRALYADSAATRVQLDAAETALARAEAAVNQARAGANEVQAMMRYAVVRAPFAGSVTRRFVDPGDFAAPGAPLVAVQDGSRLRLSVSVAPDAVRDVRRGATLAATIEGVSALARVEGVVPAPAGNLYTVNAIVDNGGGRFLAGSAATIALPQGRRQAILVPLTAVRREGNLTGVTVRGADADELRWVRLGSTTDDMAEVLSGLRAGDQIIVPDSVAPDATRRQPGT